MAISVVVGFPVPWGRGRDGARAKWVVLILTYGVGWLWIWFWILGAVGDGWVWNGLPGCMAG